MAIAKDFPRRKKPGTLRGWLLTYNIVMLCIILALVIILFILVFSLLGEMQERNNIYQALTNIHQQLIASRELYKRYGEISSQIDYDEVLKEFKIILR